VDLTHRRPAEETQHEGTPTASTKERSKENNSEHSAASSLGLRACALLRCRCLAGQRWTSPHCRRVTSYASIPATQTAPRKCSVALKPDSRFHHGPICPPGISFLPLSRLTSPRLDTQVSSKKQHVWGRDFGRLNEQEKKGKNGWRFVGMAPRSSPSLLVALFLPLLSFPAFAQLSNKRLCLSRWRTFRTQRYSKVLGFSGFP